MVMVLEKASKYIYVLFEPWGCTALHTRVVVISSIELSERTSRQLEKGSFEVAIEEMEVFVE